MNGWEIALVLMTVAVLSARYLVQPDSIAAKKTWFYFLMTVGAIMISCLLALVVNKVLGW